MKGKILFRFLLSKTSGNRGRNLRVLIGLALTFAVIITVLCSMEYLSGNQISNIKAVRSFPVTVESADKAELEALSQKFSSYNPFIYQEGAGYLVSDGEKRAVRVRYIDSSYRGAVVTNDYGLDAGEVILPARSWRRYGGTLSLTRLEKGKVVNVAPRSLGLTLADIYATRLAEFDDEYIFMSLEDAPLSGFYTLAFMPEEKDEGRLIKLLESDGYKVITTREREATIYGALQLERAIMTSLLSALYIIFIFQIIQNASLLSKAKKRELAALNLMGIKKGSLCLVFSLMGFVITAISFLCGILLSRLFIKAAPYMLPALKGVSFSLTSDMIAPLAAVAALSSLSYFLFCRSELNIENVREAVNAL